MARRGRRARVRAGGPAPRPARLGPQGHRAPADGGEADRGARRHRDRRRRARGVGADLLRPARAGSSGRKGLIVDKVEDLDEAALVARVLEQLYGDAEPADVPKEVLVPHLPEDQDLYEEFLGMVRGSKVRVRVPQRGREARAARPPSCATRRRRSPATSSSARRTTTRAPRRSPRCRRRSELPEAPLRIECFDISNLQGTEIVASMTVLEDGIAEAVRLPPVQDPEPGRPGRLRGDGGGAHPPVPPLPARTRRGRARRQAVRVPAEPARHRRRQGPARRRGARARGPRAGGHQRRRSRQAVRGGVPAGGVGAGAHPARLARRSTCSSRSATRPTGSRSRTTAPCATRR